MSRVVISSWSAVSTFGIGRKSFADGIGRTPPPPRAVATAWGSVPPGSRYVPVPDFDPREVLGRKGTRAMDRASAFAVTAVRELLDTADSHHLAPASTAVVLGTTNGSVQSSVDITRDTLTHDKPYFLDAAAIPNALANRAAAQCAIWHRLTGPNATIAGGRAASPLALRYALRLLTAGRADTVLCGGTEELSAIRAWLEYHGTPDRDAPFALGEGCALVWLQRAERPDDPRTSVLGVHSTVFPPADLESALHRCVRTLLAKSGAELADVWACSATALPGYPGDRERAVLDALCPVARVRRIPAAPPWGDAGAATGAFQLAALLAQADSNPAAAGRLGLSISVDRDGLAGAVLLRFGHSHG